MHLPDEQTCTYQPNLRSAEESLKRKKFTMLTEYFEANNIYGELTQSLKYEGFPFTFVWNDEGKLWTPRQRQAADPEGIGRMVSIHPTSGDIFYLRLLLKNRASATSFYDLKTVEGMCTKTLNRHALRWIFVKTAVSGLTI